MGGGAYFDEIDVSGWMPDVFEPLGTKPKIWLTEPGTGDLWLFKNATSNRRADQSSYLKGDDWAERVAKAVAELLGLPAATAELAYVDGGDGRTTGIISKKVLADSETLVHGNELLAELGVVAESPRDRRDYTLETVRFALYDVAPPFADTAFNSWEWFVGYLVLDALIGNTDRHQENWAVVENGGRRLAPTFDHASSLGFQLDDTDRSERLQTADGNRTAAAYAARAKSKFEGAPHPCEVARMALDMVDEPTRRHWLGLVESIAGLEPILRRLPSHRMSEVAKKFAAEVFASNRAALLSHPSVTVEA